MIYIGQSTKNQKEIAHNSKNMQKVYVGDKLVWQKGPQFTTITHGLLYNWPAAMDARKISSSDDFVVPSDAQWITLSNLFGGDSVSGGKLKETGTIFWDSPNTGADNLSGFTGRGTGERIAPSDGYFAATVRSHAIYWTSTNFDSTRSRYVQLQFNGAGLFRHYVNKGYGRGLRLLYTGTGTPTTYTGNDGKIYPVVKIGAQYWISVNLAETKYRDGSPIPEVTDNAAWALADGLAKMCAYNNDWSKV